MTDDSKDPTQMLMLLFVSSLLRSWRSSPLAVVVAPLAEFLSIRYMVRGAVPFFHVALLSCRSAGKLCWVFCLCVPAAAGGVTGAPRPTPPLHPLIPPCTLLLPLQTRSGAPGRRRR